MLGRYHRFRECLLTSPAGRVPCVRSRPVVHVQASLQYQTGASRLVDLADPTAQCRLNDGRQVPCVSVLFCMTYDGVEVDRRAGEMSGDDECCGQVSCVGRPGSVYFYTKVA